MKKGNIHTKRVGSYIIIVIVIIYCLLYTIHLLAFYIKRYPSNVLGFEATDRSRPHRVCGFVGKPDGKLMRKGIKSIITNYVIKRISRTIG